MLTRGGALVPLGPEDKVEDGFCPSPSKERTSKKGFALEIGCTDDESGSVVRAEDPFPPSSNEMTGFRIGDRSTTGLVVGINIDIDDPVGILVDVCVTFSPTPRSDSNGKRSTTGFKGMGELLRLVLATDSREKGVVLVWKDVRQEGPGQSPPSRSKLRSIPIRGGLAWDVKGLELPNRKLALGSTVAPVPMLVVLHEGPGQRPCSRFMLRLTSMRGGLDVCSEPNTDSRPCKTS